MKHVSECTYRLQLFGRSAVWPSVSDQDSSLIYKRSKRSLFVMARHDMRIFEVSPFFKLQKTLKQQLNGEK